MPLPSPQRRRVRGPVAEPGPAAGLGAADGRAEAARAGRRPSDSVPSASRRERARHARIATAACRRAASTAPGLVAYVYGKLGVELPHNAAAQYSYGRPVDRKNLKPGDLVFFHGLGHVGLYIGRGRIIHAPQSGERVEIQSLAVAQRQRRRRPPPRPGLSAIAPSERCVDAVLVVEDVGEDRACLLELDGAAAASSPRSSQE